MALISTDILGLSVTSSVTATDFYLPGSSVLAQASYRASARTLLSAAVPATGSVVPSTGYTVTVVKLSDGLAYSISVSDFMTALHGIPGGGTTGQILGKLSNADYDVDWVSAGTVFSVGLSMPAVFSVANSPITGSGILTVTANGTSGGIPYFNAATTMASSGVLAANRIVLGGGAGTTPATLGSLGTTTTVLHGNAAGAPTFGAVDLTADVTGTLPVGNGGTGVAALTAHYLPIGNGTSAVTLLAPSATTGIPLVSQGSSSDPAYSTAVVAGGGTGLTSATAYAVLCGGTTSTGAFQSIASVGTSGQVLVSNGAGALPTFQTGSSAFGAALTKVDDTNVTLTLGGSPTTALLAATSITAGWSGQLGLTRGGTAASLTASTGGIVYSGASALAILSGTATANQILVSGSSAAPSWSTSSYPATSAAGTVLASLTANTITATASPVLGASGTSGTLGFTGSSSGVVTVQPQAAAGTYNFNLPTGAGTSGQPLLSAGGGASPMTFGTLGVAGGGTGAVTLTANAVLLGNGTSAVAFATIGTGGRLLIDQGAASNPAFTAMSGDATIASSGAITLGSNVVSYAKFQQAAGLTLLGVTGSSTANYGAITGTANQLPFVNSGASALAFGALSILLDNTMSSTQGAIMYRGASTWTALGPGSSGQFLQTQGAGLNPSWTAAAGGGSVTSVTVSAQGLTINGIGGSAGGSFNVSGTITPIQGINAQTGTTYTVLTTDHTKLVTFNNASPCAVTLPQANGAGFSQGFWFEVENYGAGLVTITPTTSTVDGATLFYVGQNQGIKITSDGTNYQVKRSVVQSGEPAGRVTLSSGVPVMTTTVSGATTIYYTPYVGSTVPIYNGTSFVPVSFAELSQATTDTTKSPAAVGTIGSATNVPANYDLFVWVDSGTVRCTRGPAWTTSTSGSAIVSVASPGVVSWTSHGLRESAPVIFTGAGLPTGLTAGTTYYVSITSLTANSFVVSTSVANATAGTNVNTSGSSTGTQTVTNNDTIRGTGAGTSQLTLTNGINLNTVAITNGPAASRGTYVGTVRSNASSQIDWIFGLGQGTAGSLMVWNYYNRRLALSFSGESTDQWTYQSATIRAANATPVIRTTYVCGMSEDFVQGFYAGNILPTSLTGASIGVQQDASTTFGGQQGFVPGNATRAGVFGSGPFPMGLGVHYLQACENCTSSADAVTFYGDNGTPASRQGGMIFTGMF